jgi:hypothetical protein
MDPLPSTNDLTRMPLEELLILLLRNCTLLTVLEAVLDPWPTDPTDKP